ncbi:MAG: hypothetical protein KID00_06700 [Clostridium argentinense]|uniref:DUF4178 domain-containing protein n=1 Tax=Clostridium faecium TaxID=2762223 RepID=A0ABR8YTA2_9CLOT|nr:MULTISPECIES: hypothetical protein [Clostridium]MBD8047382.1 hypothetical protein [Clostridium faecium]MBS5823538.1 hypothetical protein [Clostridium argentinense]MDU1350467.1 hypothetical protein [Clostridium argentinense]
MEYLILETEDERVKLPVSKFKGFSDYDHKVKLSMSEEEILEVVQYGAENEYVEVKKLSRSNCCEDKESIVYKLENFDIKRDSTTYEELLYYKSGEENYEYDYLEDYDEEDEEDSEEKFNIGYRYIEDEKDLDRDFGESDFYSKALYIIQCECGDWEIFID